LKIEAKRTKKFLKFADRSEKEQHIFRAKRNTQRYSKVFQERKETNGFVPKKFESKRNKKRYSKVFQERRGTIGFVQKKIGSKRNKERYSKTFPEQRETN